MNITTLKELEGQAQHIIIKLLTSLTSMASPWDHLRQIFCATAGHVNVIDPIFVHRNAY